MINPTTPVMDSSNPGMYTHITTYSTSNPVERLKLETSGGERTYLNWDGTFKLNLFPLFCKDDRQSLNTQITLAQQIIQNDYSWFRPSTSTVAQEYGYSGEAKRTYDKNKQESLEWLVNYGFRTDKHNFTLMGGYSYQYFVNDGLSGENKDFASDLLGANNLGAGSYMGASAGRTGMSSYKNDSKLIAFFGRVTYNYLDRYFLTASIRHEGSSKFGANHKWGNFPAVSAGWRISDENFMKGISWISDLKIRTDYGETGNQDFDSYQSLATMSTYDLIYYQGNYVQGWGINTNPNPDLKWEKGKNWNIGVDFSLLNYTLEGSLNYYNRKQSDLLGSYSVPVPPNVISTSYVNVGTMRNTGIEIDIKWNAVRTKDFDYSLGFVGATSNNKFLSFSNQLYEGQTFYWMDSFPTYPGNPGSVQRIEEGERVGNFYTFKYAGVDEDGNWLIYNKDGEKIPVAQGTDDDKAVVGNGMPKFTASLTNNFRYKNFDLMLYFRGAFGYQIYDCQDLYYGVMGAAPGTNVLQSAYKENAQITEGKNVHSSYFVHDGDFVKLDVLTLGYTWKINRYVDKIRLYMTGRNIFTIRSYNRGLDPDSYCVNGLQPGIPYSKTGYYPSTRQYLLGVQIDF
jgi:TonB-linked SusC/RagA family outer membrane protein